MLPQAAPLALRNTGPSSLGRGSDDSAKSDRQIACELSMDPDQVRLIRMRDVIEQGGERI